jgi:hypothetical protein
MPCTVRSRAYYIASTMKRSRTTPNSNSNVIQYDWYGESKLGGTSKHAYDSSVNAIHIRLIRKHDHNGVVP